MTMEYEFECVYCAITGTVINMCPCIVCDFCVKQTAHCIEPCKQEKIYIKLARVDNKWKCVECQDDL